MDTNNKIYIGMDLHKNTSTFCVKDYDGNILKEKKVLTDKNQIGDFIKSLDGNKSIVLEPVSQWYTYVDFIEELGCDVHLAHPKRVKAIASARIKTDKIDASVLSDLLRSNLLPEAYISKKEVRSWKEIVRFRASLINLRTQVKNKVHAILNKNGLRHNFSDLFGKSGKNWLITLNLKEPFNRNLDQYISLIDFITEKIDNAEELVKEMVNDNARARLLTTIPGISYVSALTIIAEIGEILRFPSAKKLMAYSGLVPSTYSSGDITRHGRITKTGSKWLRYILIEAAHHQILCKKNPGFGSYYLAIKERKGSGPAAVATARKLLAVIWRLLVDNREFQKVPPIRGAGKLTNELSS